MEICFLHTQILVHLHVNKTNFPYERLRNRTRFETEKSTIHSSWLFFQFEKCLIVGCAYDRNKSLRLATQLCFAFYPSSTQSYVCVGIRFQVSLRGRSHRRRLDCTYEEEEEEEVFYLQHGYHQATGDGTTSRPAS